MWLFDCGVQSIFKTETLKEAAIPDHPINFYWQVTGFEVGGQGYLSQKHSLLSQLVEPTMTEESLGGESNADFIKEIDGGSRQMSLTARSRTPARFRIAR